MDSFAPTLVRKDLQYWLLQPDARLRQHVRCYFVVDAHPGLTPWDGRSPGCELLIPDGHAEIVFTFDAAFERWNISDHAQRAQMRRSYVIGGRSHSVLTRGLGHLSLIGAKLDPRALRRIIATPLAEFRDSTLELRDLNCKPLLLLEDALAAARSVREIAGTLDRFFLRQLSLDFSGDPLIDYFLQWTQAHRGAVTVTRWMREHGIDSRTLERRFCAWIGMGPKQYARVVRFKHSYHRLITREPGARGPHHYLDGYYDQSHFNKEFRRFVGDAPSALIAERTRSSMNVANHLLRQDFASP